MSQKTWGGRFSGETDNRVEAFTESISFDRRLYRHDVIASQAHARMLAHVGLLTFIVLGLFSRARRGLYDGGHWYQVRIIRIFAVWLAVSTCILTIVMSAFS